MARGQLVRYKTVLEPKQASLERGLRYRERIAIEKTPDLVEEVQLAADRELAIRTCDHDAGPVATSPDRSGSPPPGGLRYLLALRGGDRLEPTARLAVGRVLHQLPAEL